MLQADDAMQAAIAQITQAASQLIDGFDRLKKVQISHVQTSADSVIRTLNQVPEAMQGDPAVSLGDTLNTWHQAQNRIGEELADVVTKGTPIEQQLSTWIQPNGALPQLKLAVEHLHTDLKAMVDSLERTFGEVAKHKSNMEAVAAQGGQAFRAI
jgi:hypothetical protein